MHRLIRNWVATKAPEAAQKIQILYGGSVKADNATELFSQADIDGGLIGGASLDTEQFAAICQAANVQKRTVEFMYETLLVLYLLVAIALIALIMIQQGKGADMGASFGAGASNTVFGSGVCGKFPNPNDCDYCGKLLLVKFNSR